MRRILFLVLPFVFISDSRGTLTATCRVHRGLSFLRFFFLSPRFSSSFSFDIWKTLRGLPQFSGERTTSDVSRKSLLRNGGARRGARDGTRVTRCAYYDYIIFSPPVFSLHSRLAFIIHARALHLQSSSVL